MKIALVGSHPETWDKAPFDDFSWEIWGFSRRNHLKLARCDVWFELHHPSNFRRYDIDIPGYVPWLKGAQQRMTYPLFPWEAVLDRYGPYFLTGGQISWMMAYAIMQEPEAIGLWGVEAAGKYQTQRYEIWHFTQVARDMGIEVVAPAESELLDPPKLYAFSSSVTSRQRVQSPLEADTSRLNGSGAS